MALAELNIHCNFPKCRKCLSTLAWVTSCSHAFCEEDGIREFENRDIRKCPACKVSLTKMYDIVQIDLNPSEQYKSMILAGLKPEILCEIMKRAITFWNYQICQEHLYQVNTASKTRESMFNMDKFYEKSVNDLQAELDNNQKKLAAAQKEIEALVQSTERLKDNLDKKSRQINKMQRTYDAMCRSTLISNGQNQDTDSNSRNPREDSFKVPQITDGQRRSCSIGPKTMADVVPKITRHPPSSNDHYTSRHTPSSKNHYSSRRTPSATNQLHTSRFSPRINRPRERGQGDQGFEFRPVTPRCNDVEGLYRFNGLEKQQ